MQDTCRADAGQPLHHRREDFARTALDDVLGRGKDIADEILAVGNGLIDRSVYLYLIQRAEGKESESRKADTEITC